MSSKFTIVIFYAHKVAEGNELRYNLRSLSNLRGDYQVVVVGDPPSWYSGPKIYYPHVPNWRYQNCYRKMRLVLDSTLVSEHFSLVHDDTVFLKSMDVSELKIWYTKGYFKKPLKEKKGYSKIVNDTAIRCFDKGYFPSRVNTHWPWYFEKAKLFKTMETFGTNQDFLFEIGYAAQHQVPLSNLNSSVFEYVSKTTEPSWNSKVLNYSRISPKIEYGLRRIFDSKSKYESDDGALEKYKLQAAYFNEDFPCEHLGKLKKVIYGTFSKKPEPVYECAVLGECSIKRIDNSNRPRCIACRHYNGLPKENIKR